MAAPVAESVLELQVGQLRQLFNAMDPAPFRERDLDPNAEAYIVDWAHEVDRRSPLALDVNLTQEAATDEGRGLLRDAIHTYFRERAASKRRELKRRFRHGRLSLVIGLAFAGAAILAGEFLAGFASEERYKIVITETFVIGGWVALWEPIQIFLYDWWPIRGEAKLFDRLAAMRVDVTGTPAAMGGVA
ncbi:MAG: hypothetical protein IT522_14490 [Burkholderiales bacterium]|nr:hypothetical protein [Burkholderiales bacterium]